ncbi:MAG: DUF255 domain-containing protein [Ferruginibacter sp.]
MQKFIRLFIVFGIISMMSFQPPGDKINWISIPKLNELYSKNPKPILLDVYTDWCGWCKEMDRKTFGNQKVADYINEHYYAVKLDAESRDSLLFNNIKYGYDPQNKNNGLAEYLLFGRMEFPTTVFLSAIDARPAPLSGYMNPKELEAPLKYFGEGAQVNQTFIEFNKNLRKEW